MDIEYIRKLIRAYKKPLKTLAKEMNTTPKNLERKLNGEKPFEPIDVIYLVKVFDKPIESFFLSDRLYYQGE